MMADFAKAKSREAKDQEVKVGRHVTVPGSRLRLALSRAFPRHAFSRGIYLK
jgi:hypothetical protein